MGYPAAAATIVGTAVVQQQYWFSLFYWLLLQ